MTERHGKPQEVAELSGWSIDIYTMRNKNGSPFSLQHKVQGECS